MSGTVYDAIQAALDAKLATFATANGLVVAWQNTHFEPTPGSPWLEPFILPGEPSQAALGETGENRCVGIYQVKVKYPAGEGSGDARVMADTLITAFKRGTKLTYGVYNIEIKKAYQSPAIQKADWYYIPVTIQWSCFAANI